MLIRINPVAFFNLDVIISVGYSVKSKQGTHFRIWATNVLREYLLKEYAFNQRIDRIEHNVENLTSEVRKISLQLKTQKLPTQGVFFEGQIFDAYELTSRLIRLAETEIILIDNYINESTLVDLSKKAVNVKVLLYTKTINKQLLLDVKKANDQFGNFEINEFCQSHDRFLTIYRNELYYIGASLKDLGKKWFAFTKMDVSMTRLILEQLNFGDAKKQKPKFVVALYP